VIWHILGKVWGAYRILVGKPEGKRSLRTPTRRWEGTIKCILNTWDRRSRPGLIWLRTGVVSGSCNLLLKKKLCSMESVISCLSTNLKWVQAPPGAAVPSIDLYQGNQLNNNLTYFESVLSNKLSQKYTEQRLTWRQRYCTLLFIPATPQYLRPHRGVRVRVGTHL
jgi:hypothetical protein